MHLVCLGVMKKLLMEMWVFPTRSLNKLSREDIAKLSSLLISIQKYVPYEFMRKTRTRNELKRWKVTEYRFFLYCGPFVLKNILPSDKYLHFLVLHVAIRILLLENHCEEYREYAHSLLQYFVHQFKILYGIHLS